MVERTLQIRKTKSVAAFQSVRIFRRCALIIFYVLNFCSLCPLTHGDTVHTQRIDLRFGLNTNQAIQLDYMIQVRDPASTNNAVISEFKNYSEDPFSAGAYHLNNLRNRLLIHGSKTISDYQFLLTIDCSPGAELLVQRKLPTSSALQDSWTIVQTFKLRDLISGEPIQFEDQDEFSKRKWSILQPTPSPIQFDSWHDFKTFTIGQTIKTRVEIPSLPPRFKRPGLTLELHQIDSNAICQKATFDITTDDSQKGGEAFVEIQAPLNAGVYEARWMVIDQDDTFWTKLTGQADRDFKIQRSFMTCGTTAPTTTDSQKRNILQIIQPSVSSWFMPDWLANTGVKLPAKVPPSFPLVDQRNPEVNPSGQLTSIAPNASFETKLANSDGIIQIHSMRLPSQVKTKFEVSIGSEDQTLSRQFTVIPNSNADLDDSWQTITWVRQFDSADQIKITNLDENEDLRFRSITVENADAALTSRATKKDQTRSSILRLTNHTWVDELSADYQNWIDQNEWSKKTVELFRLRLAMMRLKNRANRLGFDTISIPVNEQHAAWYPSEIYANLTKAGTESCHYLQTVLSFFDDSDIGIILEFNPSIQFFKQGPSDSIRESSKRKIDKFQLQTAEAQLGKRDIMSLIGECLKELEQEGKNHPCFVGFSINSEGPNNALGLSLESEMNPRMLDLSAAEETYSDKNESTSEVAITADDADFIGSSTKTDQPIAKQLFDSITDFPVFIFAAKDTVETIPELGGLIVRDLRYTTTSNLSGRLKLTKELDNQSETPAIRFSQSSDASGLKNGMSMRSKDLATVIEKQNPQWIFVNSQLVDLHFSESDIRNLRIFADLPDTSLSELKSVDPNSATVRIWKYFQDDRLHLLLINLVPWSTEIDLETNEPLTWEIPLPNRPDADDPRQITTIRPTRARVKIKPGTCMVIRSTTSGLNSVRQWTNRVSGGPPVVKRIKQKVTDIVENIGYLNQPTVNPDLLSNGSFERVGEVGILGWLHAQHPDGCVELDHNIALHGMRSVRLQTEMNTAGRTWIMSEAFAPPESGRIAVSLSIRGVPSAEITDSQQVRVAIETTEANEPLRVSKLIEVQKNAQWLTHDLVLEIDGLASKTSGPVRLAIDNLKPGTVWIDDVRIYDYFPTQSERADLQRRVFLAVQGMQRGNLLPAGKLLDNFWIQYLLSNKRENSIQLEKSAEQKEKAKPTVAETLKDWIPDSLRF